MLYNSIPGLECGESSLTCSYYIGSAPEYSVYPIQISGTDNFIIPQNISILIVQFISDPKTVSTKLSLYPKNYSFSQNAL